ncbi:MAG: LuxR C-terminal-related transcriptional regulator, partial [Anaerolineae bacterium]
VMQQHSLLQTKLYIPPIRRELVSRPRLIDRLNAGLNGSLTLVSAPAGFGKTTLVSEWVHKVGAHGDAPPHMAWLSLDEGDNDPARFLAYLIAALRTIEATIGRGVLSALQSPQPPPAESVLISLINEVAALPDSVILIFDDQHTIESSPVDNALTFLLDHLPPNMHLVIASREDPHLPLARLRARGQLTELRASDLRFTTSEAAEFLNHVMGLDLSAEDIAVLERRTEGWIAGLQLAAISMQGRQDVTGFIQSFAGSHHFVLDYLLEEVLEQQAQSVQSFLLQTAILDRLTGSLCDAVRFGTAETPSSSGGTAFTGQAILEMLEQTNLFIVSLDDERRWYRYHHLFADLLRQRLRQTQPEQIPTLQIRASEWYEQNGIVDEAIEHALRAEDFERAANLLEAHVDALWQRGEHTKLWRWQAGLPLEMVFSKPRLCIPYAFYLFNGGQLDAAEQSLQAAEQALDLSTDHTTEGSLIERDLSDGTDEMKLQGRVATIRAFIASYRGDVPGIIQYARKALDYLPEQDLTWRGIAAIVLGDAHTITGALATAYQIRLEALEISKAVGDIYLIMIANLKVAVTLRMQGQLGRVIEICQQQMELAHESGMSQIVVVGWLLAIWGEALAELNDLDRALDKAKKGVELTEGGGEVAMLSWSYLCLTRVLYSRGDMTGTEEIVRKMETTARESDLPPSIINLMAAWQARTWLAQDELDAASQWVGERELNPDGEPTYLREMEYIVLARILIAQERLDEATRLLQQLLEAAEGGARTSRAIEILMLQALAFRAGGDTARAMTALQRSLTLAEPRGFLRIYVDEGPPMARLLYEALSLGIAPEYSNRLLAAFPVAEPEQAGPSTVAAANVELIEPLSERELEVLGLIAEGLTNPEIASRLFVSLNTVKAHARNIYGKLGVHNRTQAVTRARALGILPST